MIGANGAGKSTFLKALTGLVKVEPGMVRWRGVEIGGHAPGAIVRLGLALVPEGRRLFPSLSVEENLLMGAFAERPGPWSLGTPVRALPDIGAESAACRAPRCPAGSSRWWRSARALMSNPKLLLCDELSLGLAPIVIKEIYDAYACDRRRRHERGHRRARHRPGAASLAACGLPAGGPRSSLEGRSGELTREQIAAAYFGLEEVH